MRKKKLRRVFGGVEPGKAGEMWVISSSLRIHSLKLTAKAPENGGPLEKGDSYWKPPFLGAKMLVLGRVSWVCFFSPRMPVSRFRVGIPPD